MKNSRKITVLGAGNVGASIAYTLTLEGICSEVVLIDINEKKAQGEAMDIRQGLNFTRSMRIYAGGYEDAVGSDVVVVTIGAARRPGQSRIDLAQGNVEILRSVMPRIVQYAPHAVYVVVSNPVDILTYAALKFTGLPAQQVIGSGTMLDTSRLRSALAERVGLTPQNVHAYVLGEHGDSSVIPWSLTAISGMAVGAYCSINPESNFCNAEESTAIEDEVRHSGARVIDLKGATYYAIAMSVARLCECILRDLGTVFTVSSLVSGSYGIEDVCLSLPFVVDGGGVRRVLEPPLLEEEKRQLLHSAQVLKTAIASLTI